MLLTATSLFRTTCIRSFHFATPQVVSNRISDKNASVKYLIVDVRDPDAFNEGHITSAINIPVKQVLKMTDAREILEYKACKHCMGSSSSSMDHSRYSLLFHCSLSLVRGPKAAAFAEALMHKSEGEGIFKEVVVLDGGFKKWESMYGSDLSSKRGLICRGNSPSV